MKSEKEITVKAINISDFFVDYSNLIIPDYQRPYVWDTEKIDQILLDWEEHFYTGSEFNENSIDYYLGTLILFKNADKKFEIIDGQQRITTILLINLAWGLKIGNVPDPKYSSLLSKVNLKNNYDYLKNNRNGILNKQFKSILDKLVVTVITTIKEDDAFIFFDTQNNRGVNLDAVDFLKSYHLRELKEEMELQKIFASKWDKNNINHALAPLFDYSLWRARNWRGNKLEFEDKDKILKSFQKGCKSSDKIKLYPGSFNSFASSMTFSSKAGANITPNVMSLQLSEENFPFTIRQPINKGSGFFLYTEKYNSIYNLLFNSKDDKEISVEIKRFYQAFKILYSGVNIYLKSLFKLVSIVYYDRFKDEKLHEFALWLDYLLGSFRLKQHAIVHRTMLKIIRENNKSQNLLDFISMAFEPGEIFTFISDIVDIDTFDKIKKKTVRAKYFENQKNYYKEYYKGINFRDKYSSKREAIKKMIQKGVDNETK